MYCRCAISRGPGHVRAHLRAASASLHLDHPEEALTYYRQALHIDPSCSAAQVGQDRYLHAGSWNAGWKLLILKKVLRVWEQVCFDQDATKHDRLAHSGGKHYDLTNATQMTATPYSKQV